MRAAPANRSGWARHGDPVGGYVSGVLRDDVELDRLRRVSPPRSSAMLQLSEDGRTVILLDLRD